MVEQALRLHTAQGYMAAAAVADKGSDRETCMHSDTPIAHSLQNQHKNDHEQRFAV